MSQNILEDDLFEGEPVKSLNKQGNVKKPIACKSEVVHIRSISNSRGESKKTSLGGTAKVNPRNQIRQDGTKVETKKKGTAIKCLPSGATPSQASANTRIPNSSVVSGMSYASSAKGKVENPTACNSEVGDSRSISNSRGESKKTSLGGTAKVNPRNQIRQDGTKVETKKKGTAIKCLPSGATPSQASANTRIPNSSVVSGRSYASAAKGKVENPTACNSEVGDSRSISNSRGESKKTSLGGTAKVNPRNQIRQDETKVETKKKGTAIKGLPSGATPSQASANTRIPNSSVVPGRSYASAAKPAKGKVENPTACNSEVGDSRLISNSRDESKKTSCGGTAKICTYQNQVTVADPLIHTEHQKAQRKSSRPRDHISEENANHADTIRKMAEKIYKLRERIIQLEAAASRNELTKEQINFIKMGMILLDILTEVSYTLLKQDKPGTRQKSLSDLYSMHRELDIHKPSNSSHQTCPPGPWGKSLKDILDTDITVGDDIERIRHIRNKLSHSVAYHLNNNEFDYLCKLIRPLLSRFDQLIGPTKSYTVRLDEILKKKFWWSD